jgi:integrase
MQKSAVPFAKTQSFGNPSNAPVSALSVASGAPSLSLTDARQLAESWLLSGVIAGHSESTRKSRASRFSCLFWWHEFAGAAFVDETSLKRFLAYLRTSHTLPGGRFGEGDSTDASRRARAVRPISSGTVKTYHAQLRAWMTWLQEEGYLSASPMARIKTPIDRPDQVQPFSPEQLTAILTAAKKCGRRDEAISLLLLDTGLRASELVGLTVGDIDLSGSSLYVRHGKGDKGRSVPFANATRRALHAWITQGGLGGHLDAPLFTALRGTYAGEGLTTWGLGAAVERWGKTAGVNGVRVSPHTFRHTFAVMFLRAGGNAFTLKELLGHTTLSTTNRYVALVSADLSRQHARFSPVESLRAGRKGGGL